MLVLLVLMVSWNGYSEYHEFNVKIEEALHESNVVQSERHQVRLQR